MTKSLPLLLLASEMIYFTTCLPFNDFSQKYDLTCSNFFCREAIRFPKDKKKCEKIITVKKNAQCACYRSKKTSGKYCDGFSAERLRINVNSTASRDFFNEPKLEVISGATRPHEFNSLTEIFFHYFPLTNITDFRLFSNVCRRRLLPSNCDKQYHSLTEGATLNLTTAFKVNKIERLNLNHNCIRQITGSFSSIMPELRVLELRNNLLRTFRVHVFRHLERIENLDLSCNEIAFIRSSKIVFDDMSSLKKLDLSLNVGFHLDNGTFAKLVNLEVLNMSNTSLFNIPVALFRRNVKLRVLDLSYCRLGHTGLAEIFNGLTNMRTLVLEGNLLTSLHPGVFQSNTELKYLNLKRNRFHCIPDLALYFSRPIVLQFSENCLRLSCVNNVSLPANRGIDNFTCQSCCLNTEDAGRTAKLAKSSVDFRNNPIEHVDMEFIRNISHLKKVYLHDSRNLNVNIQLLYPSYRQVNFTTSQTHVYISEYSFEICDVLLLLRLNAGVFKSDNLMFWMQNITTMGQLYPSVSDVLADQNVLNAVCDFTLYCPPNCQCYTQGIETTITVNCTGRNFSDFPTLDQVTSPIKLYLSNNQIRNTKTITTHDWAIIKELFLDNNLLESLENVEPSLGLQALNLRHNQFIQFSALGLETLQLLSKYRIRTMLSGNPWQCDCGTPETKIILLNRNFEDFPDIACTSVLSGKVFFLQNITDYELCPLNDINQLRIKVLLPVISCLVISISVGIVMCHRHKELIKLWLFTKGYCLRFVIEEDIDTDKTYDAFVSFSSFDEEWVANHLVDGLEKGDPPYKLCLHSRDWLAGEWIVEQIFKSVKQSRRTIIVLTDHFVESDWGRMEFAAASQQAVSENEHRIIVVVPRELPAAGKLGEELRRFITLNTYIKWRDPYFWRRLRRSMPRVRLRPEPNGQRQMTTTL